MKRLYGFVLLVFIILTAAAVLAAELQDVVYLKNGSIIRGTIMEQVPNESLKIQTKDGSLFVYTMKEVKKIAKEPVKEEAAEETTSTYTPPANARTLASNPEKMFALLINPLGFLQFGPEVELEVKTIPNLYLVGMLRWHGVGVLSNVLTSHLDIGALGYGGGLRYFIRTPETPDALYVGMFTQFTSGTRTGTDDIGDWKGSFSNVAGGGEIGYRWRYKPGLITVGAFGGAAHDLASEWHYVSGNTVKHNNDLLTYVFGMLELSFGVEF
jgi:hypothetical protein